MTAHPSLEQYEKLAEDFVNAYSTGDSQALRRIAEHFELGRPLTLEELRAKTQQDLTRLPDSASGAANLALADARDLIADSQGFENWLAFAEYIEALNSENSPISQFESAVDAVVTGDLSTLERLLHEHPELIRARSARQHGATLLHYVAANGVEDFRQKSPKNSVEIAKTLLAAGAEVDADLAYGSSSVLRKRYPGRVGSTTLGLAATSIHPAHAGVQIALMETLLDAGAAVDDIPGGWGFVNGCLANGRPEAARFLAMRGARLDLESASGVGRLDLVQSFFEADGSLKASATKQQMESGFMWACEYGHTKVAEFLLDIHQGDQGDRSPLDVGTQVGGMTGLHWAMVGGRLETIKLLLERGAPLEVTNSYGGTALGCAIWAVGHSDPVYRWPDPDTDWAAIIGMLIGAGARVYETDDDFPTGNQRVDELLRLHGMKP